MKEDIVHFDQQLLERLNKIPQVWDKITCTYA